MLNACASLQASQDSANEELLWKEQVEQRLDSVADKNEELAKLRARVSLLEAENKREFTHAQNELAAMNSQLETLKQELESLKSRRSKPKGKAVKKAKNKAVEKAADAASIENSAPKPIAKQDNQGQSERAKRAYYDAYFALKNGDYFESSLAFRNFLRDFPGDKLAGEAKYWYGESLLAQGEAGKALLVFQDIINGKSFTPRHAAAMLKAGFIHEKQQQQDAAISLYSQLIRQHPASSEAETARSRLKQQNGQG
ncbi:tetratricopeptide repeat protein [Mariprofundus aestuarium]|uniref:tetratricopeptide repeat protein n=1 Tax=Mariprofundus aestuarium TaxID=1921086 RepID=UPI001E4D453A|nr:tetratricopeptide repeat protein [Mariprofundus aestuarium]